MVPIDVLRGYVDMLLQSRTKITLKNVVTARYAQVIHRDSRVIPGYPQSYPPLIHENSYLLWRNLGYFTVFGISKWQKKVIQCICSFPLPFTGSEFEK